MKAMSMPRSSIPDHPIGIPKCSSDLLVTKERLPRLWLRGTVSRKHAQETGWGI